MTPYPIKDLSAAGIVVLDCEHKTPPPQIEGFPYIAIPDVVQGRVCLDTARRISLSDFAEWTRRTTPRAGDVLVTRRGRVGDSAPIPDHVQCAIGQNLVLLRSDGVQVDQGFLRWAARSDMWWNEVARLRNVGAVFSSLNVKDIARIRIPIPEMAKQRAIAEVLGALDDKIAANERVVHLLLNLMECSYEAAVHRGSTRLNLEDVGEFHNRRRVPLSAREREGRPGGVPYYGATGAFDHVDEALFDEVLVLVGEDGSVITESGGPVVQYIWGPAWVNNHAHVLTGNGISTELLRFAVSRADVRHLVTGAVQPKISMGKLQALQLDVPIAEQRSPLEDILREHSATLRVRSDEIHVLSELRDALLPQLMSGKIRVKDAEHVVSEAV